MGMSFRSSLTMLTAVILGFSAVPSAQADTFFWQDPGTKLTMSVPDTWAMIHNQKTDDVLTFIAPSEDAFPKCRMRVRQDRRFLIYPHRYATAIQHLHYSEQFWEDYAGEFPAASIDHYADDAGLGRGRGSFAEIYFEPDSAPKVPRKAIVFAALYRDKAYILECSANVTAYDKWLPAFLSVAKSVEFRQEVAQTPGGHYKKLFGSRAIEIMDGPKETDVYFGYGRIPQ